MVIILGLGFTGSRLARRLLRNGVDVSAAVRDVERFRELADSGARLAELAGAIALPRNALPRNAIVAHLIPPLAEPENSALRETILSLAPTRVVYISSTGVYGGQIEVDSDTPAEPNDDRGRLRLEEERWIASGPWTSLILRSAAIYGPGRGVHTAIREGKLPRGAGSGIVSRIHVEDLAAIVEAGLFSDLQGAWPVADEVPCSSDEIAEWCANQLQLKPITADKSLLRAIPGRKVDGRKVLEMLGVKLKYRSWHLGIPASIAEENTKEPVMPQGAERKAR